MTVRLCQTPLYEHHLALGAKLTGFAGWELPVRYSGVVEEHRAVRERAGLFDVSHMGQLLIVGPDAEHAVEYFTCNAVSKLYDGRAQYSALLNPEGGVIDDVIVYRHSAERYLLCVNAVNVVRDYEWLLEQSTYAAEITDASASYGLIAVQGPLAEQILSAVAPEAELAGLRPFHFKRVELVEATALVARTGYTGEDGFELFLPWEQTGAVWDVLLAAGRPLGVVPVGLGARDTLRLEAAYPLHGHELREDVSALESGLGWIVKFSKEDFVGRAALQQQRGAVQRKLVGFVVEGAGIVREGTELFNAEDDKVGEATSGTKTPTVNRALGLALVRSADVEPGARLVARVRGRELACKVVDTPFYSRAR